MKKYKVAYYPDGKRLARPGLPDSFEAHHHEHSVNEMKSDLNESGPGQPSGLSRCRKEWLLCVLLTALVWIAFAPALKNGFVTYDDPEYVVDNFDVQQGVTAESIRWAFQTAQSANWHPLTWLSHMIDCRVFGLAPWGHHLTNIVLHLANTVLLFRLLTRLMRLRMDDSMTTLWKCFFVAALFGLHPMHVESVAWVSERKDVLSTLFWLLTLLCYAGYVRTADGRSEKSESQSPASGRRFRISGLYLLALFCFACGLMSKPMLVTLPFVLLLLDYWPLERVRSLGRLLWEKVPFFALSAASCLITLNVQKHAMVATVRWSWHERTANALVSYARYLGKLFWPADLSVNYPLPERWPMAHILLAAVLLAGITGIVVIVLVARKRRYLLMGWLLFLGTLVPVIGLVQVGEQSMADRYSYIPSIGIFITITWAAWDLMKRSRAGTVAAATIASMIVVLFIPLTRHQVAFWFNGETLFRHAIAVTADRHGVIYDLSNLHENLGFALDKKGRADEAFDEYQQAVRLSPYSAEAHVNMGIALGKKDRNDDAIEELQMALDIEPDLEGAHYNLGNQFIKAGQLDESVAQYLQAIKLKPDDADAHSNLGIALSRQGRFDEAITEFQESVRLKPHNAVDHNNLGAALYRKGRWDEAIVEYQKALDLDPGFDEARKNMGMAIRKKQTAAP